MVLDLSQKSVIQQPFVDVVTHHSSVIPKPHHAALQLTKQHAAIGIWLLGRSCPDRLGQGLCAGLGAVGKNIDLRMAMPPKAPPVRRHGVWQTDRQTYKWINKHTTRPMMVIFCIGCCWKKLTYLELDLFKILIRTYLEHVWIHILDINRDVCLITRGVSQLDYQ